MTDSTLPAGVIDSLSQFQIGGPMAPRAAADGATSGISRDQLQDWLRDIIIDNNSSSGVAVNADTALKYPPCFYAIQKVSGHLGMMSWRLRQRLGPRLTRDATDHPAYRLLKHPHALYSGSVFTEVLTGHMIYRGNGRAYIERDKFMRPLSMTIMLPEQWATVLIEGEKWHLGEIMVNGRPEKYRIHDRDVLHLMGFSKDGISGVDVLQLARDSIGLGMAAERQQAKHFARNAIPGLLLKAPKGVFMKDGSGKKFLDEFRDMHEGPNNTGKTALLTNGVEATQLSHTGRDSQTIESRQFQREEVALWWMLESMIGEGGQSYNSEEQRQLAYLKGLPGKAKKRWEEERDAKLLSEAEKNSGSHFHQLNAGSLLQADMQTTLTTLKTGIEARIYSPNDARDILGLDEVEGGDKYENPNTSSSKQPTDPPPAPAPNPPQPKPKPAKSLRVLREKLQAAYASRLEDLWNVEAKRVRAAAAKGDAVKFAAWCDGFYGAADWPKTIGRVWQEFGGSAEAVDRVLSTHASDLGMKIKAEPDDLIAAVEEVLNGWQSQPSELAATLTREADR